MPKVIIALHLVVLSINSKLFFFKFYTGFHTRVDIKHKSKRLVSKVYVTYWFLNNLVPTEIVLCPELQLS